MFVRLMHQKQKLGKLPMDAHVFPNLNKITASQQSHVIQPLFPTL